MGAYLSSFDLTKIGYLYLREGKWNNKQIVPAEWIRDSTQNHISANQGFGYGYQWWIYTDLPSPAYKAWGGYSKHNVMIIVVPNQDMIVVLVGYNNKDKHLLKDFIFPSIKSTERLSQTPEAATEFSQFFNGVQ